METKYFDVLVVSSSPAMVLEALRLKRSGLSVGVFDDRERIGGAWYVKDLFGYKNVEVGCHFLYNNTAVYDFLDQLNDSAMETMEPQPTTIVSGLKNKSTELKSRFASAKFTIKRLLFEDRTFSCRQMQFITAMREMLQQRKPGRFFSALKELIRYTPYRYFRKGCGEFMSHIQKLTEKHQLEIHFGARIRDVIVEPGKGGSVNVNDTRITFGKLLLSKHVKFDSLTMIDKVEYKREPWRKKHFLFHIKGRTSRKFSYVDVANDPVLKRVSNVGIYCDGIDNEHLLICSDTTEEIDLNHTDAEIKDLIFKRLEELRFITKGAVLLDYFVEQFVSDYTPKEKLRELNDQSVGVIISIDTSDLGKSIDLYRNEWKSIFK